MMTVNITFMIDHSFSIKVENFFINYDIDVVSPDKGRLSSTLFYEIPITFLENENAINKMKNIRNNLLKSFPIDDIGENVTFQYSDDEFKNAPFFKITSTGNSPSAHLSSKNSIFTDKLFCPACGIVTREVESLSIDTSKLKNRFMVSVDGMCWVISEKMAELMENWNLRGYQLVKVKHFGNPEKSIPAYRVIAANSLPEWNSKMQHYYFVSENERRCDVCQVYGRIDYPYRFDQSSIEKCHEDFYNLKEWASYVNFAYHPLFVSKKFKDLVIEHGITKDVRSIYNKNYGSKDWVFTPIIVD